jgi:hypothetical protein
MADGEGGLAVFAEAVCVAVGCCVGVGAVVGCGRAVVAAVAVAVAAVVVFAGVGAGSGVGAGAGVAAAPGGGGATTAVGGGAGAAGGAETTVLNAVRAAVNGPTLLTVGIADDIGLLLFAVGFCCCGVVVEMIAITTPAIKSAIEHESAATTHIGGRRLKRCAVIVRLS